MTTTCSTESLTITSVPATGVTVRSNGAGSVDSIKAVRHVTLTGDDARRTFTSPCTDGKTYTYRLTSFVLYEDGSVWAWAAQLTKKGQPFKNGMGLTLGDTGRMAEFYGQGVADVMAEAIAQATSATLPENDAARVTAARRAVETPAGDTAWLDVVADRIDAGQHGLPSYWCDADDARVSAQRSTRLLKIRNHIRGANFASKPDTSISVNPWPSWTRHGDGRLMT